MTTTYPRGSMPDFDISPTGPLQIGIGRAPGGSVRIRATDLRGVAHQAAAVRDIQPGAVVVVDIDVMIAHDARSARALLADAEWEPSNTLLYVGTPAGLAGLITDIHALGIAGIADGAVLLPVAKEGVLELIYREVLPELSTMEPLPTQFAETDLSA
jgi:hypothetical protein